MTHNLHRNASPGHCVLCGARNFGCLCPRCWKRWKNADGTLPPWLYDMRKTARNLTYNYRCNARRIGRNPHNGKRGRGQPRKVGIRFVSLERLLADSPDLLQ